MADDERATMTVPEAAKALGIGRNQGYEAARAGQIPTIRIGKRLLVPRAAFESAGPQAVIRALWLEPSPSRCASLRRPSITI